MSRPKRAIVIGGGVGGLCAAIRLAEAGLAVQLFERAEHVGGKLRHFAVGGRSILGGPSVLTMPFVFDELFGGQLADHLELVPVDPLCRHFFPDGSVLDLFADEEKSAHAIELFSDVENARGYRAFRRYAQKIYEVVRPPFLERSVPSLFDFLSPRTLLGMSQIDSRRTLWRALADFFPDPRLRQLFARYATYNGSSPFHAPATLAVIAHAENGLGVFACPGGLGRLAEALAERARTLGVEIITSADVEELLLEGKIVRGVRLRDTEVASDVVVANCDVAHLYERLLGHDRRSKKLAEKHREAELSLSGLAWLALVERAPIDLGHHSVFFSADYAKEFEALIDRRQLPAAPTIYLCAEDRLSGDPPDVERAFFLLNAPPRDRRGEKLDWEKEKERGRAQIEDSMASFGWRLAILDSLMETPATFERDFPGSRGALYGLSSNDRLAAFRRPHNRVPSYVGLYATGGSAHPGAGLPMVALSAKITVKLVLEDLGLKAAKQP
jgi:1-hydroxycarotenoid 3,4-desaturase